ncbi:hypothetical protein [Frigoribacterium sp. RIT-PI-h]|uniref:hypothetical protein n=1 Tax=Frigoribacterium sp. RIT-PI-h TaxID=1690245 RepID=UPI0006B8EF82|nr:hypothetical protein [Frigoribacterium sp. RIT-PI-h]KPG83540.1 hypothetical protein AEQ27_08605 [Frigoribacterium sp. RIT-PI-h]
MFLGIDWGAFVVVFVPALAVTAVIVTSFALGIRLFADGAVESDGGSRAVASNTHPSRSRPLTATVGGGLCFAVGTAAVLFGLWMIVPQFH